MRHLSLLAAILAMVAGPGAPDARAADLVISEFMAANTDTLADADGDFSDWLELHNAGGASVNLDGWYLTDTEQDLQRWRFPAVLLDRDAYLLVFASGKDRRDPAAELHANFRLAASGEYLALIAPDGVTVAHAFAPVYPPQREGISYGLVRGEPTLIAHYFRTPTPGAANDSASLVGFVADTTFSRDRGFYAAPFSLEIATTTPGATIRYTLDGTRPAEAEGLVYTDSIRIDRTTTVRAAAFAAGLEPTNVDTHTYLFLEDIILQDQRATLDAGFPGSWGGTAPDYGMDPDVIGQEGQDRYGGAYAASIRDDLLSIPTLSIVMSTDDMFGPRGIYTNSTSRGVAWERPCSVELIYPRGGAGFQVDAGIRIQGGYFRQHGATKKHSLRLLFKSIYGASKLRYPIFGPGAPDRFDTITLRAGANDGYAWDGARLTEQYTRDEFGRSLQIASGNAGSHGMFVHLYIDGIYWGLYNPAERPDHSFCATYFGGEKEDWDSRNYDGFTNGNATAWNAMIAGTVAARTSLDGFQKLQGLNPDGTPNPAFPHLLDVPEYIDYLIVNVWGGNWDWPWKNWWAGRLRTADSTGFKFFCWDYENTMGNNRERSPLTKNALQNDFSSAGEPHRNLVQNPEYRLLFADRVHAFFFNGGILTPDPLVARYSRIADGVERAIVGESARWGEQHFHPPLTLAEWRTERNWLLNTYLRQRTDIVLAQLRSARLYPSIAAPAFSQHGGEIREGFALTIRAPSGTVYYTLDGSDPRLPGGAVSPSALVADPPPTVALVDEGAPASILVPRDGALGRDWTAVDFDDAAWTQGSTGVGFDLQSTFDPYIATDLESSLYRQAASVYVRLRFTVADPSAYSSLILRMRYDDGFVAYLNGTVIDARNAPAAPAWNSAASASHTDAMAVEFESTDLPGTANLLRAGWNVLAIHGLNASASSDDMLIMPRLDAVEPGERGGIALNATTLVRARAQVADQWSALNEAWFRLPRPMDALRFTEIMYNPRENGPIDGEVYEFIELKNTGASVLDLTGAAIQGAVSFAFAEGTVLSAGAIVLIVADLNSFFERYPSVDERQILGEFRGNLSNAGEILALVDADGATVAAVPFDDQPPWPVDADGFGPSLVPVAAGAGGDPAQAASWRASTFIDGSPGEDDPDTTAAGFVLPGDFNRDAVVDIADVIAYLQYSFSNRPVELPCGGESAGAGPDLILLDVNGDARVNVADPIYLLGYLFQNRPPPILGTRCVRILGCPTVCAR